MNCLSSAFPEWNAFTSERCFLRILVVGCWEHQTLSKSLIIKCASAGSWVPALTRPCSMGIWAYGKTACVLPSQSSRGVWLRWAFIPWLWDLSGMLKIQRIVWTDPSTLLYSLFPVWRAVMERWVIISITPAEWHKQNPQPNWLLIRK